MLLGVGVIIAAADDLAGGPEPADELKVVLSISFFSIFVFGALTFVKFRFGENLNLRLEFE